MRSHDVGRSALVVLLLLVLALSGCTGTPASPLPSRSVQELPPTWTPSPGSPATQTPTPNPTQIFAAETGMPPLPRPATALPSAPQGRPEPISLLPAGARLTLDRVQMLDVHNGWAVGTGGQRAHQHIFRTHDGGQTWRDVSPPELIREDDAFIKRAEGFFLDAQNARVVYSSIPQDGANAVSPDTIWRTQDGGQSWEPASLWQSTVHGTACWDDLTFLDSDNGWYLFDCWQAMGSYVSELYHTMDGGRTWELLDRDGLTNHRGIQFADPDYGWVPINTHFRDALFLAASDDGGLTWQERQLPYPDGSLDPGQYLNCGVSSPSLQSSQSGWLIVRCPADRPVGDAYLYRSYDGASNWRISPLPGKNIFFLDSQTGWALSDSPLDSAAEHDSGERDLFQTLDGGQTWTEVARVAWYGAMQFLDLRTGWALSKMDGESTLLRTSDGGRTWERLAPVIVASVSTADRPVPPRIDLPPKLAPLAPINLDQMQVVQDLLAGEATDLAVSPRGDQLALAHRDGRVSLWDLRGERYTQELPLHTDWVYDVAYAPEGGLLASASKDGSARLLIPFGDCHAGPVLTGHGGEVTSVAIYDGILATSSQAGAIALWEWESDCWEQTAMLRKQLDGHAGWVWDVVYSPDGSLLASASADRLVRLWEVASDEAVTALAGEFERVSDLLWSPNAARVVTISEGDLGALWDAASGQLISELGKVSWVSWSPDGQWVALFEDQLGLRLWDAGRGRLHATLEHPDWVTSAAWSPDGGRLATASFSGVVSLWDAANGQRLAELTGHTDWVADVIWSPNGSMLASKSADGTLRLWEGASGASVGVLTPAINVLTVAWSSDGSRLAAQYGNGTVGLWDPVTGEQIALLEALDGFIEQLAWSPDGSRLAGLDVDGALIMWSGTSGAQLAVLEEVSAFVWSPESRLLSAIQSAGGVELWDVETGEAFVRLAPPDRITVDVLWSPDGLRLATVSEAGVGRVWLAASGEEIASFEGGESIVWSPRGELLASFAADGLVRLWEAPTGRLRATIEHPDWARGSSWTPDSLALSGHQATVWRVTFSPDWQRLASASWDGTVKLWEVAGGRVLHTLAGHTDWVRSLAFTPDGQVLASGSVDGRVIFWDVQSGEALHTLSIGAAVEGLGFTPDGRLLAVVSSDGWLKLWGVR